MAKRLDREPLAADPDVAEPPPSGFTDADFMVTRRAVTIYGLTARQRAELADLLGLDRSVRRLPRPYDAGRALAGVKLDSQYGYDVEAAVAYAFRNGLECVEDRESTAAARRRPSVS